MELKWILAIGLEAAFWLMLAAFLVLRYRYGMEGITRLFVIGVGARHGRQSSPWASGTTLETGTVSIYTLFIAAIVVYSLTAGQGATCAGSTAGWHARCGRAGA